MKGDPGDCWICGSKDAIFADVLGMFWCKKHYDEEYL